MALAPISSLVELTAVDPDADFVEIVDASAAALSRSKKVLSRRFARWELAASWTFSSNVTQVDFTNLSAYSELRIMVRDITLSVSGVLVLQVSSDNGSTWKTTSGEYSFFSDAGVSTDNTLIGIYSTIATAVRSGVVYIIGWNLAQPKPVWVSRSTAIGLVINDAEACNAIRAIPNNGGNMTGGSIYVYGR